MNPPISFPTNNPYKRPNYGNEGEKVEFITLKIESISFSSTVSEQECKCTKLSAPVANALTTRPHTSDWSPREFRPSASKTNRRPHSCDKVLRGRIFDLPRKGNRTNIKSCADTQSNSFGSNKVFVEGILTARRIQSQMLLIVTHFISAIWKDMDCRVQCKAYGKNGIILSWYANIGKTSILT